MSDELEARLRTLQAERARPMARWDITPLAERQRTDTTKKSRRKRSGVAS